MTEIKRELTEDSDRSPLIHFSVCCPNVTNTRNFQAKQKAIEGKTSDPAAQKIKAFTEW